MDMILSIVYLVAALSYAYYLFVSGNVRDQIIRSFEKGFTATVASERHLAAESIERDVEEMLYVNKPMWVGEVTVSTFNCAPNTLKASFLCGRKYVTFILQLKSDNLELLETRHGALDF